MSEHLQNVKKIVWGYPNDYEHKPVIQAGKGTVTDSHQEPDTRHALESSGFRSACGAPPPEPFRRSFLSPPGYRAARCSTEPPVSFNHTERKRNDGAPQESQ